MQPEVADALVEAANLLLVGMVVVFLFLSMLIAAIKLISYINQLLPDEMQNATAKPVSITNNPSVNNQKISPNIVAAISAAIIQHRQSPKL